MISQNLLFFSFGPRSSSLGKLLRSELNKQYPIHFLKPSSFMRPHLDFEPRKKKHSETASILKGENNVTILMSSQAS